MQLQALFYADWRALVNDVRRIRQAPGRLVMWLLYGGILALFFWGRVARGTHGVSAGPDDQTRADFIVCALFGMVVFSLATGRGKVGVFRSPTEARFIVGSPIAAPLAIAYLQAREALGSGLRFLTSLLYFLLFFGLRHVGIAAAVADLVLALCILAASAAIVVPRRLLAPRAGRVCALIGLPLGLLAFAPALRDFVVELNAPAVIAGPLLAHVPAWHPGRILLEPNVGWIAIALGVAAAAIGVLAVAGRDIYPELYELSLEPLARLERMRRRINAGSGAAETVPHRPPRGLGTPAPPGVLVFIWKSVVEFRRTATPQWLIGGVVFWAIIGVIVARLVRDDDPAFAALSSVVILAVLLFGMTASESLAIELRRPMFWLSQSTIFERLCAMGFARIWRLCLTVEILATGFALAGGGLLQTVVIAIGLPSLIALSAGVGFAAFALFPNVADGRGPVTLLRLGVCGLVLAPPLGLFGICAAIFAAPVTAALLAALLALIESGAFIGIAAWRLDGQIDRLPA